MRGRCDEAVFCRSFLSRCLTTPTSLPPFSDPSCLLSSSPPSLRRAEAVGLCPRPPTPPDPFHFARAEYNGGRCRMDRCITQAGRGGEARAEDLLKAIDFPSTRKYVEDITARYHFYQAHPGY